MSSKISNTYLSIILIIILLNCFLSYQLFAQPFYDVEQMNSNDGLSHDCVQSVFQDSKGFIWFGTEGGLNKYDGYNITEYRHNSEDSTSLNNNYVWTIFEDPADSGKILWIGTQEGLSIFNKETENFSTVKVYSKDSSEFGASDIIHILKDSQGFYWIGGIPGVKSFDRKSGIIKRYLSEVGKLVVEDLLEDRENNIWIATRSGLFRHNIHSSDSDDENFTRYGLINNSYYLFVTDIYEDNEGVLWIGTNVGLYYFNRNKNKLERPSFSNGKFDEGYITFLYEDSINQLIAIANNGNIRINPSRDSLFIFKQNFKEYNTLYETTIRSAMIDKSGNIWIGTTCKGVFKFKPKRKNFELYQNIPDDKYSLSNSWVVSFGEDKYGTIYTGTIGGSLNQFNRATGRFYTIGPENMVTRMSNDKSKNLWYTNFYALVKLDRDSNKTTHFYGNGKSISFDMKISSNPEINNAYNEECLKRIINYYRQNEFKYLGIDYVYIDNHDVIWCICNLKLYTFDQETKKFLPFKSDQPHFDEIISGSVRMIFMDSEGNIWIGTREKGLIMGRPKKTGDQNNYKFYHFTHDPDSAGTISDNTIYTICEDKNGNIWIGTRSGLNSYNSKLQKFTVFLEKDGINTDVISGILCDDDNNLWISTIKGLSLYDQSNNKFTNFDERDGLQSRTFSPRSCFKANNGEMYFGGSNGFNVFHPKNIQLNPFKPNVAITSLSLFNKPCKIEEGSPLKKSIELSNDIIFEHDQDVFTFEFAALDFTLPSKNRYAYMMEGVDPDWVHTSADRRFATYTKLDPGEYLFRVKGSNNDGIWNEEGTSIKVIILPPWWRTYWAYSAYILLIFSIIYSIWRFQLNRIHLKHEAEIEHFKAAKYEEMDRLKTRFFANISHEFRTPLTLILGPVEKIITSSSNNIVQDAGIIKKSASRLLQLVNQLLDLSKLESGKLKLSAASGNIVSFIKRVALSFESLLESKDITLKLQLDNEHIELYFDNEKMLKILSNLLSNACKFTPENGKITITVNEIIPSNNLGYISIKIRNTGIGIPEESFSKLFDRFYQVDNSLTKEYEGTGIGLALTKELVELHHGNISVDSKISNSNKSGENWTEFTLIFPLGSEHLKPEEIIIIDENYDEQDILIEDEKYFPSKNISESDDILEDSKTIVLVIEDNYDMREYIKESLSDIYQVEEAINGEQGIRIAGNIIPDLIISDLMMPKLDGKELTRILKNDEKTSHIPIIILTAKAGQESKLEGLQTGADDYLTKPFDLNELRIRIENLISIRKILHEKFSDGDYKSRSGEKKLSRIDEKFMTKVDEVVEKHLGEEDFSIEEFSSEVGMGRTQLHRKLKALVGKSPSQFIRSFRLTRARKMIKEKHGNISEIAYSVGFSSPAYFTKCFKDEFDYPPSDLIN